MYTYYITLRILNLLFSLNMLHILVIRCYISRMKMYIKLNIDIKPLYVIFRFLNSISLNPSFYLPSSFTSDTFFVIAYTDGSRGEISVFESANLKFQR